MKAKLEIPASFYYTHYDNEGKEWNVVIDEAHVVLDVQYETPEDLRDTTDMLLKAFEKMIKFKQKRIEDTTTEGEYTGYLYILENKIKKYQEENEQLKQDYDQLKTLEYHHLTEIEQLNERIDNLCEANKNMMDNHIEPLREENKQLQEKFDAYLNYGEGMRDDILKLEQKLEAIREHWKKKPIYPTDDPLPSSDPRFMKYHDAHIEWEVEWDKLLKEVFDNG
jgi:hypothetical protein